MSVCTVKRISPKEYSSEAHDCSFRSEAILMFTVLKDLPKVSFSAAHDNSFKRDDI